MTDADVIAKLIEECPGVAPFSLTLGAVHSYRLARILLRALKHRTTTAEDRRVLVTIVEHIRLHLRQCVAVRDVIDRGLDGKG